RKVRASSCVTLNVAGSSATVGPVMATWLGVNELARIASLKTTWIDETLVFTRPLGVTLTTVGGIVSRSVMVNVRLTVSGGVPSSVTRTVIGLTLGDWFGVGVQVRSPLTGSMCIPVGAPGAREKRSD